VVSIGRPEPDDVPADAGRSTSTRPRPSTSRLPKPSRSTSLISPLPMTGRPEARLRPIRAPPDPRTRPSPTAHRTILRTPTPMPLGPPPLRLLSGTSRAHGRPPLPRLFESLLGQTPRPTLPPPPAGRLKRLFLIPHGNTTGESRVQSLLGVSAHSCRCCSPRWEQPRSRRLL